jgi:uncharacterized repeat protein (TIGR02543 family)
MKKILLFLIAIFITVGAWATGISASDSTAPCDNTTLGQTNGTANIEVEWTPNVINVSWYDGDTQISGPQTCTYDDDLYLPNVQPTKTGYTFKGWTVEAAVPNGYTRLKYIQTNGNQYINTGLTVNAGDIKATAVFEPTNMTSPYPTETYDYSTIFGRNSYFQAAYTPDGRAHIGNRASSETFFAVNTKVKVSGVLSSTTANPYYVNDKPTGLSRSFDASLTVLLFTAYPREHSAVGRLYSFVAERNGEKIMQLFPARRNSDNVVGMYDIVSKTFFTNAGSGSFIAGDEINNAYTFLEYIESNGYQYINTGLTVNSGDIVASAVFMPTNLNVISGYNYSTIFGRNSNFQAGYTSTGKAQIGNKESSGIFFHLNTKVRVSGTLSSSTAKPYYVDDVATGLTRTFSNSLPIFLFASESGGGYGATGRMYNFTAIRNNVEIMHLVPAIRNSDNALGMWDTVGQTFYTNSGSGSFVAGPVVQ